MFARFFRTRTGVDVADTPETKGLEATARNAAGVDLVRAALAGQAAVEEDDRDVELVNLCLELLSALAPTPVDAYIIQELPDRGLVVVPGRSS